MYIISIAQITGPRRSNREKELEAVEPGISKRSPESSKTRSKTSTSTNDRSDLYLNTHLYNPSIHSRISPYTQWGSAGLRFESIPILLITIKYQYQFKGIYQSISIKKNQRPRIYFPLFSRTFIYSSEIWLQPLLLWPNLANRDIFFFPESIDKGSSIDQLQLRLDSLFFKSRFIEPLSFESLKRGFDAMILLSLSKSGSSTTDCVALMFFGLFSSKDS